MLHEHFPNSPLAVLPAAADLAGRLAAASAAEPLSDASSAATARQ